MFNFTIPGEPKGKGRPRATTANGRVRTYTPEATANYENLVKVSFLQAHGKAEPYAKDVPLVAKISAFFSIPQSASKKKQAAMEAGIIKHTHKVDSDNIAKICLDALNKLAYYDDSQICELYVKKLYSKTPRVEIQISEVE
jgi:Holliday junction resolvase RusA-like endonuclease